MKSGRNFHVLVDEIQGIKFPGGPAGGDQLHVLLRIDLHIYAGHLTQFNAMIWLPLILTSLERLVATEKIIWVLVGSGAVAMQIFSRVPRSRFLWGLDFGDLCFFSSWANAPGGKSNF